MKRLDSYSQHFLRSPRIVEELLDHTSIGPDDTVYDIGAGSGVISSVLAKRCKKVIAVEVEPRTAMKLRDNMMPYANVEVREEDFLSMQLPPGHIKIFANIPFHHSASIVRKITERPSRQLTAYLIVQRQFANKLLADNRGFTSQLGALLGPVYATRIVKQLNRSDYLPRPNVDTVLLELAHREVALLNEREVMAYTRLVVRCFSDPEFFAEIRSKIAFLGTKSRPSQLVVSEWIALFHAHGG